VFLQGGKQIASKEKFWSCHEDQGIKWESPSDQVDCLYSLATIPDLEASIQEYFHQSRPTLTESQDRIRITKIKFIKNCCLQNKFEANFIVMANQQHHIETSPFAKRYVNSAAKEAVLNRFSQHYQRVSTNFKIKLLRTWMGFSGDHVDAVCNTGPADLRNTDKGYFGAGIYSTLQSKYAMQYAKKPTKDGDYCLLLCWIAVGNVYPICRDDYPAGSATSRFYDHHGDNGIALKPGFDSHCACVETKFYHAATFDPKNEQYPFGENLFDEIVVKESSQVLPYCIVYFKK
jgi:hypothetical protein